MCFVPLSKLYGMLKIGVLGAGHLGKIHIRLVQELKEQFELVGFYDPFDDKNYRVMLLYKDNSLGLCDVNGLADPNWGGFKPKEKIKRLPEILKLDNKIYWVLRTSIQTYILDYSGQPVAQFEGYKRVRPDSKIEVISSNEVVLSLFDKKNWILNLDSGIFTEFE